MSIRRDYERAHHSDLLRRRAMADWLWVLCWISVALHGWEALAERDLRHGSIVFLFAVVLACYTARESEL